MRCFVILFILTNTAAQIFGFVIKSGFIPLTFTNFRAVSNINTVDEFESILKLNGFTIVDFSKSNCKACEKALSKLEELSERFKNNVSFYNVNVLADKTASVDQLKILKSQGIRSVPTFILYKNGERIDSVSGANFDELEELIFCSVPQVNSF